MNVLAQEVHSFIYLFIHQFARRARRLFVKLNRKFWKITCLWMKGIFLRLVALPRRKESSKTQRFHWATHKEYILSSRISFLCWFQRARARALLRPYCAPRLSCTRTRRLLIDGALYVCLLRAHHIFISRCRAFHLPSPVCLGHITIGELAQLTNSLKRAVPKPILV